tara:strand:+ start:225 stop:410 length:186 start_codon:yes stop_codon:yes gene_type:complete
MKKFILFTPLTLLFSLFSFTANIEAASCSSHKNKNVKTECSLTDENCDDTKLEKKFNKVKA